MQLEHKIDTCLATVFSSVRAIATASSVLPALMASPSIHSMPSTLVAVATIAF